MPNESGECFESPWFSTSHGESPSFDSRMSTIASANIDEAEDEARVARDVAAADARMRSLRGG